ncbi:hypothetical protein LSAT2_026971 [Lamellibrachia satsuma]|nr:hypothetical protein LSAT2_026971 [Lamellibrachia satsuma]
MCAQFRTLYLYERYFRNTNSKADKRNRKFKEADRLFSKSSVTSAAAVSGIADQLEKCEMVSTSPPATPTLANDENNQNDTNTAHLSNGGVHSGQSKTGSGEAGRGPVPGVHGGRVHKASIKHRKNKHKNKHKTSGKKH